MRGRQRPKRTVIWDQADHSHLLDAVLDAVLVACTDWTVSSPMTAFREGLTAKLQQELACHEEKLSLDQLIALTIKLGNLLRTRRSRNPASANITSVALLSPGAAGSDHEPMQLGSTQLSPWESIPGGFLPLLRSAWPRSQKGCAKISIW